MFLQDYESTSDCFGISVLPVSEKKNTRRYSWNNSCTYTLSWLTLQFTIVFLFILTHGHIHTHSRIHFYPEVELKIILRLELSLDSRSDSH